MGGTALMFSGFSNYSFFSYRPIQAEGGTVSDILVDGRPYRVHKFTTVGNSSFTIRNIGSDNGALEYLIVGGGGSGGRRLSGGGGAGGLIESQISMGTGTYAVQVGAGGQAAINEQVGFNGGQSMFGTAVAVGGGGGGGYNGSAYVAGANGGSGGGGGASSMAGGSGTTNQGYVGGSGQIVNWSGDSGYAGGGGGGAAAAGTNALGGGPSAGRPGAGGAGKASSITGTLQYYAGGGGGHQYRNTDTIAAGGSGVGGNGGIIYTGGTSGTAPTSGAANTGSGGGGGGFYSYENSSSGAGGSGIVIVRYPIGPPVPKPYMTATGGIEQTYTSTVARTNLMTNPGFEVNSAYGANNVTVTRGSTEDFYTGTKSWKFVTVNSGPEYSSDLMLAVSSLSGNTTYTISMWIKATAGAKVRARAQTWTTSYGRFDTIVSPEFTMTGNWQRIHHTWTTASDIIDGEMGFTIDPVTSQVVGYLDGMLLEVSQSLGSYFDGSTPGASWSGTANASTSTYSQTATYRSHTFLTSGNTPSGTTTAISSFTVSAFGESPYGSSIDFMVVGGGGAGGDGGAGGGAGGVKTGSAILDVLGSYLVITGAGGNAQYETGNAGNNGSGSSIANPGLVTISSVSGGGGGGGSINTGQISGQNGGSGGGAHGTTSVAGSAGAGVSGQGYPGSASGLINNYRYGGGGGGASQAGVGYTAYYWGGFDGQTLVPYWVTDCSTGISNNFRDGTTQYYAGGGSGTADFATSSNTYGGGGFSYNPNYSGYSGVDGKGGGGGAGFGYPGRGGSGIVVIRYRIA